MKVLNAIPDIIRNFGATDWITAVLIIALLVLYPIYRHYKKKSKHTDDEDYSEETLKRAEEYRKSAELRGNYME